MKKSQVVAPEGEATAGQFLELTTDTNAPLDCDEPAQYGSLAMTPLGIGEDTDDDGCTDYDELGGSTDPFNPGGCPPLS